MEKRQKVLVIVGPTASGKSALGVSLAKKFNGEIISADSRQVYRGLDIGTGKIPKREMRGVPHYLLDIASPKRAMTAHEFARKAEASMKKIRAHNSLPIIVGGTGFYIDALLGRASLPDVPPSKALRARLHKMTAMQLHLLLKRRDPARAKQMDTPSERNNKVRVIRALEIAAARNTEVGPRPHETEVRPRYDLLWLGIKPTQAELERKILKRLKSRIKQGMIAESKRLHAHGISYKRMEQLGLEYRSLARLLQKKITKKEFEEELFRDIRRYAKKQMMYWQRNNEITWHDPKHIKKVEREVETWLRGR
jgi:tRNA dimethylallyltransferase